MSKIGKSKSNSVIYERLQECHMTALERETAVRALRDADLIVDGILWVVHKLEQAGNVFLKPSLPH